MSSYHKLNSLDHQEIIFGEGSALKEDFKVFSKKDFQRIDFMREMVLELLNQNLSLTAKNIANKMQENNIDPQLIDAVLGIKDISNPVVTTKEKLIQFLLAQNQNLSQESVKKYLNNSIKTVHVHQ